MSKAAKVNRPLPVLSSAVLGATRRSMQVDKQEQMIRYVVTVKAIVERVETVGKVWDKTTASPDAPYAYTPEIQKIVQREVQLLEQRFESLDMRALVAVLNNLPVPLGQAVDGA